MRKAKYRIWDNIEKQMVDVQELEFDDITGEPIAAVVWRPDGEDTYPVQFTVDGEREAFLIEYTGLKDKNGREIYEGDIVKGVFEFEYEIDEDLWETTRENIVGEVVFQFGCFGVLFEGDCFKSLREAILSKTEVIGNIHENPELLESEK